jgi:polysaccharide export outer membrane protein
MKKFLKITLLSLFFSIFILSSCVPLKDYVYVQGNIDSIEGLKTSTPEAYRIQPNDNLYIQIISNDELAQYFNLSSTDRYLNNDAAIELGSYKVNNAGEIDFPYIGTLKVSGLTTPEIKEIINKSSAERLVQYSVLEPIAYTMTV